MPLAKVDLNLLLVFETLLRERSVSRAARQLGMAQSSLSGALGRLRIQLEDELFVRTGGAMAPTAFAARLAPAVVGSLAQLRGALDDAESFVPRSATRTFTIGSSDYTSFVLLPRIAATVAREAPSVTLRIVEYDKDDVPRRLGAGHLDVALGVFPDAPAATVVTRLYGEHFVGVCRAGHPSRKGGRFSLASYVAADHALVSVRGDTAGEIDKTLAGRGLSRNVRLVVPHMMALPGAIASSDLVSAVPARAAVRFVAEGVETFELPVSTARWHVHLLWSAARRREPAHRWLRAVVKAAAQGRRST